MNPRIARWLAVPCCALAVVSRFAIEWLVFRTVSAPTALGAVLAAVLVPFGLYALITIPWWRRPHSFTVDLKMQRFVVPGHPVGAGAQAILAFGLGSGAVTMGLQPLPAAFAVFGVFACVGVGWLVIARPWLALTPEGLVWQRLRRRVFIGWDELHPGGPPAPGKRARDLTLYLKGTPIAGWMTSSETMPIGWLFVDPAFLAAAIRFYVEHPEERAGIGTSEGLRHLETEAGRLPQPA